METRAAQLNSIVKQAALELSAVPDLAALANLKAHYLGKKSELVALLKSLGTLPAVERASIGKSLNAAKEEIQDLITARSETLEQQKLEAELAATALDVTLPGRKQQRGTLHPVTRVRQRIEEIFTSMGFVTAEGPEIESDYYNFTALNIPEHHPARADHDTFYFPGGMLLRTHTSPVQIRFMEEHNPPLRVIASGRVYRCDSDATHTPMFHQLEGLVVDEDISLANLKYILSNVLESFFNEKIKLRLRPSYFPFTEPSAEVDFCCVSCKGQGCSLCGHSGWIEGLGCGMVHPKVLRAGNIDSEKYSGFAFGMGLDRLAMFYYKINDLRLLFENDLSFLEQF